MKYDLLQELLPHIAAYEAAQKEQQSVEDFAFWLNNKTSKELPSTDKNLDFNTTKNFEAEQGVEIMISKLLTQLYKYAKGYTKKVLSGSPLKTLDDFGYMAALMLDKKMSKSDLININMSEITSGTDILKRLQASDLIVEYKDDMDKRKKLVKISEAGRLLMISIFGKMNKLAHLISGDLNKTEKKYLFSIMNKLNLFHHDIRLNEGKSDIETIIKTHVNS